MTETTVIHEEDGEDPSVLAQAAVASVGVSAVAAVKADDANRTAEEANSRSENAEDLARAALNAPSGVSSDEARSIARQEAKALLIELERLKREEETQAPEVTVEEVTVDPQVLPPSAEAQVEKKGSWAERHWYNDGDDE